MDKKKYSHDEKRFYYIGYGTGLSNGNYQSFFNDKRLKHVKDPKLFESALNGWIAGSSYYKKLNKRR